MKIRNLSEAGGRCQLTAFSLIELIGAIAVIALLLYGIVPVTINTMIESKAVGTVTAYQYIYTAATNHYQAYGSFAVRGPTPTIPISVPCFTWDNTALIQEGFLSDQFHAPIGDGGKVQLVTGANASGGAGYYLYSTNIESSLTMTYVLEVKITGVSQELAYDVATIVDGTMMTPTSKVQPITTGKVNYDGSSVMYMYMANSN